MDLNTFEKLVQESFAQCQALLIDKGREYAGNDDKLANFKRVAANSGMTPLQCALVYASKHFDAICTFVRDRAQGKYEKLSEPIDGRFNDMINYMLLMKAIVQETERAGRANQIVGADLQRQREEFGQALEKARADLYKELQNAVPAPKPR